MNNNKIKANPSNQNIFSVPPTIEKDVNLQKRFITYLQRKYNLIEIDKK